MTLPPVPPELERYNAATGALVCAMRDIVAAVDEMPEPTMRWIAAVGLMGHVDQFRETVLELQERSPQPE